MTRRLTRAALLLAVLAATTGCAVFRPLAFWRDPLIVGNTKIVDEEGKPMPSAKVSGVTLNFINLGGKIEESVLSAQTDAAGKYASPKLLPGRYKVEAMLPGFVIERTDVQVKNHEHKSVPFILKKIRETKGRSVKESLEENIPSPGEVQITPPF